MTVEISPGGRGGAGGGSRDGTEGVTCSVKRGM